MVLHANGSNDRLSSLELGPPAAQSPGFAQRSLLQRILLVTDGTVTELLEVYADEEMRVVKLFERVLTLAADVPWLDVKAGDAILRRNILLQGKTSGTNYLYAESLIAIDRLSPVARDGLLTSHMPIGYLMRKHRMETFREILQVCTEVAANAARYFNISPTAALISRTYAVNYANQPLMLITEKFPESHFRD